jgi:D-apiose dehydrogenase
MAILRVGLVGAGAVTLNHLTAWAATANARVVAICDPQRPRAEHRAREFGVRAVYSSAEEMLAREALDALDIASPRETHAAMVQLAAEHGLPALCQKPLAPTLAQAESLVAAVRDRCRLMVHENWRFRPQYRALRHWIDEDRLGRIRHTAMTVRSSGLRADAAGRYPSLERQPFFAGVDRLLVAECLIHQLDVLRWLSGPLKVLSASLDHSCPAIRGEDRAVIALAGDGNMTALCDGDFAASGYPPRSFDRLELVGTKDSALFADGRLTLIGGGTMLAFDVNQLNQASFDACIAHFVDSLQREREFETEPRDNLETLRIVEDAYRLSGFVARPLA